MLLKVGCCHLWFCDESVKHGRWSSRINQSQKQQHRFLLRDPELPHISTLSQEDRGHQLTPPERSPYSVWPPHLPNFSWTPHKSLHTAIRSSFVPTLLSEKQCRDKKKNHKTKERTTEVEHIAKSYRMSYMWQNTKRKLKFSLLYSNWQYSLKHCPWIFSLYPKKWL